VTKKSIALAFQLLTLSPQATPPSRGSIVKRTIVQFSAPIFHFIVMFQVNLFWLQAVSPSI
jgi:hypothetical protein